MSCVFKGSVLTTGLMLHELTVCFFKKQHDDVIDRGKKHTEDRSAQYEQEKVVEVNSGVRSKMRFFEQQECNNTQCGVP